MAHVVRLINVRRARGWLLQVSAPLGRAHLPGGVQEALQEGSLRYSMPHTHALKTPFLVLPWLSVTPQWAHHAHKTIQQAATVVQSNIMHSRG